MMITRSFVGGFILATAFVLPAVAQSADPGRERSPSTVDPKACTPNERQEQGRRGPDASATKGESTTDKLARTEGVICPPNVDPEIKAPTPEAGKTPVIPPPGSPGGDPGVRPT
jgi:hypothetical protein